MVPGISIAGCSYFCRLATHGTKKTTMPMGAGTDRAKEECLTYRCVYLRGPLRRSMVLSVDICRLQEPSSCAGAFLLHCCHDVSVFSSSISSGSRESAWCNSILACLMAATNIGCVLCCTWKEWDLSLCTSCVGQTCLTQTRDTAASSAPAGFVARVPKLILVYLRRRSNSSAAAAVLPPYSRLHIHRLAATDVDYYVECTS